MLYTAFLFGLLSSFHCVGMCGPIAMMLPVSHNNPPRKALQVAIYHIGRLSSYTFLGLLFGIFGRGLYLAGFQQNLSIFIGIAILLVIIIPERLIASWTFAQPIYMLLGRAKAKLGQQFKKSSFGSLFTIGILNGLIPCGMVYVAIFGAIGMQNEVYGMLYMLLFGLGTIPLMTAVVYLKAFISISMRNKINKMIPYVAAIVGILFILRGLGLGIPYVSPSNMSLFVSSAECH